MSDTISAQRSSAAMLARALARTAVRRSREIPLVLDRLFQQGRGPVVAFLPCRGPTGASLLRIHAIAAALRPLGWRTLVLPWRLTLEQRHRILADLKPDVVVMQGARHALNRPALYPGQRIVYDMDDADFHLPHLEGAVADAMPEVAAVIAGSRYIADWCRQAGAGEVHVVWTGTPVSKRPCPPQSSRPAVVAWAQTRPMDYRREADMVRQVMRAVAARRPGVTLRLYDRCAGDDPGFADSFRVPGLNVEWRKKALYRDYLASFDDVALGLAPLCPQTPFSRGKSFGKVLAYLDRGVPVIGSDAGEHPGFFTPQTGIIANDPQVWVASILRLLDDAGARQAIADAAATGFSEKLTTGAAARRTAHILAGVLAGDDALRVA